MVFVQHHGNFPVPRAEHDLNVQPNQGAQALFRIGDAANRIEHTLLGDLHGVVHDLVQDFVFTLKVMIEAAFAQLERGGNVVHGGSVVTALLK